MVKIPELQKVTITTLNPSDIIKCLRLKVWDVKQNKMIGLKEIKMPD
jgi:omega-6 fatty acid desaturase (delta-12 desaturase)